jgi:hypothetical protein
MLRKVNRKPYLVVCAAKVEGVPQLLVGGSADLDVGPDLKAEEHLV